MSGYILGAWFMTGVFLCWRMAYRKPEIWNAMTLWKQYKTIIGIGFMWPVILLLKSTMSDKEDR